MKTIKRYLRDNKYLSPAELRLIGDSPPEGIDPLVPVGLQVVASWNPGEYKGVVSKYNRMRKENSWIMVMGWSYAGSDRKSLKGKKNFNVDVRISRLDLETGKILTPPLPENRSLIMIPEYARDFSGIFG